MFDVVLNVKKYSVLINIIFSYSKLGLNYFIIFCYLLLKRYHVVGVLMQETNIKLNKTICHLRQLLRKVSTQTFINNA